MASDILLINDVISSWIDDNLNSSNGSGISKRYYKESSNTHHNDDGSKLFSYIHNDKESRDSALAKRLANELDKRNREYSISQKKIGLLETEVLSLRKQLNSVLRVSAYNKSNANNSIKHFHTIKATPTSSINRNTTTNAAATVANLLVDELEITKNDLEKCQKDLNDSYKKEQEYQRRLSSLYEELSIRTDELNNFGNSSIVEKTANLREGILSLKTALLDVDQNNARSTKTDDNFHAMRKRQEFVESEISRSTLPSLSLSMHGGHQYKELENERNYLLSCVKDDNIKINELAKKVELFEAKLRTSDYMCETSDQRGQQTEDRLNIEKENNARLENDLRVSQLENIELLKQYESAVYDSHQMKINLQKEIGNSKELHALNIDSSEKIKNLENSLILKNDEIKELRLKMLIKQKDEELATLHEERVILKQEHIDIDLLNEEKLVLQKAERENLMELNQLRPTIELIRKLEMDISLTEKVDNKHSKSNVSKSHLLWTKLPSLKSVLPNLQGHIQNLLGQVQHSELQFNNMSSENAELRRTAHNALFEKEIAKKQLEQMDVTINDLNRHINNLVSEQSNEQGSRALLNNVKQCITKYPEILELLFDIDENQGMPRHVSGNVSLGLASSSSEIEDKNLLDVISSILSFASHYSKQIKPLRDQLDDVRLKYDVLLKENADLKDNENMNHLLYVNDKLKHDANSFSKSYEDSRKVNNFLNDQLSNAKNEIAIKNAQLSTLSDRESTLREVLWLAIRKANKSDDNIPSSLTHLGVLLQYTIDNYILNYNFDSKSKAFNSPMTMTSIYSSPMASTQPKLGAKWSNDPFSSIVSSASFDQRDHTPSFADSIRQQRSILSNFKESI